MSPYLEKALNLLPHKTAPFLCQADLQRIHTGLGKIWYEKGREAKLNKTDLYAAMTQSLTHYKKAIAINPHDILAVLGIAETTAELEFVFSDLLPGMENTYNAFPLYKRACKVEPNGLATNYSAARYLHRKGMKKELFFQVQHIAKIYPAIGRLKKELFYSPETRPAVMDGLEQAIKANTMISSAYFSLSALAKEDKAFLQAVEYYKNALGNQRNEMSADHHLNLGSLFLLANEKEPAFREFITALKKSRTVVKNLRTIYYKFKKQKDFNGFIEFATRAEANNITLEKLKFHVAQAQIQLKLFESAKETLKKINVNHPSHEAYYTLAMLARNEKDWDAMEINIQKATVLQPQNGKYFNLLADALMYQKKYKSAATYMQKALLNDPENQNYRKKLTKIRSHNH